MIVITGGGTGGHLAIAKVLATELRALGKDLIFIGSQNGQDMSWFGDDERFKFKYFLQSSGVVNKRGLAKFFSLLNILKLSLQCGKIFKHHNVEIVISVGGYSSAPAAFGAIFFRKKLFIHEQNAVCGQLNSLLKRFCTKFFSSYNGYDYPVDKKFFQTARQRQSLNAVLFLGGSQGAGYINHLALSLAKELVGRGIRIIHQTGQKEFEKIKAQYDQMGIEVEIFPFSKEIDKFVMMADLCVSRAGASTLWELCAACLPTIFIPYPFAAKNHQFFNAKFLKDKNLCEICAQATASPDKILDAILNFEIKRISNGLKGVICPDGASKIAMDILNFK